ncbi:MAG: Fe-S cluster assembly protein IscX [Anaerolineales bacterium]|nr:Fe-S cluster assembly protein IscX [Anaerolineales bacterium]
MTEPLYWEATYAIALALKEAHPEVDFEQISLGMICQWTLQLAQFQDDPELANDGILAAIYQDWYEECIHGQ